jgi:phosphatidylethanolamine-binding protein (PEBP) family uncharacterized protein
MVLQLISPAFADGSEIPRKYGSGRKELRARMDRFPACQAARVRALGA